MGEPPARAALRGAGGLPVWWLWLADGADGGEALVRAAAGDAPVVRTGLRWSAVRP